MTEMTLEDQAVIDAVMYDGACGLLSPQGRTKDAWVAKVWAGSDPELRVITDWLADDREVEDGFDHAADLLAKLRETRGEHRLTDGMRVAMGETCVCGHFSKGGPGNRQVDHEKATLIAEIDRLSRYERMYPAKMTLLTLTIGHITMREMAGESRPAT